MGPKLGVVVLAFLVVSTGLGTIGVRADETATAATISVVERRAIEIPDTRIISLSPDGSSLVAAKPAGGYQRGQLCTYDVETLAERACADLSGLDSGLRVEDIVWSPDSSRIAFAEDAFRVFRDGDIWVMDAATGDLLDLTDEGIRGPIPILSNNNSDITEYFLDINPAWSPDGQSLAFSRSTWRDGEFRGNEIAVLPLSGGTPRTIVQVTTDRPGIVYFGIHWQADGTRLFYNVDYPSNDDPKNGIWVVDARGVNARQVAGTTDPDLGPPVAVQVAPAGDRLLAFYLVAATQFSSRGPLYALVDVASGLATPLTLQGTNAPEYAYVSLATLSPDGSNVLYVSHLTDPDYQVFVRDVTGGDETRLIDGLPRAFTIAYGLVPAWATDGSVFMNSDLGTGTLIRLAGGAAPSAATPLAVPTEGPATPGATALSVTEQRAIEIPDTRIISMSPDGRWIAVAKPIGGYTRGQLCVYDVETLAERSCADLAGLEAGLRIEDVAWSPDGSHLAFAEQGFVFLRDGDLWLMETATGALTNLDDDGFSGNLLRLLGSEATDEPVSLPVSPTFSPDGRTIAFSRSIIRAGEWTGNDIAIVSIDGGEAKTLTRVTLDTPGVVYFGIRWAPGASRLYYSVHYPDSDEPRNGIWVVDANGLNQRQLLGATDPAAGAPAVVQVSANGETLLAYYPIAATRFDVGNTTIFALVNAATGVAEPLQLPDQSAPEHAWVSIAALSPDGTKVLTVSRLTDPDNQIWVRDLDSGNAVRLGEPPEYAGWIGPGLIPTWATDGSVLIPGDGALSTATYLRIAGSAAPTAVVTSFAATPGPATPAIADGIEPGARVIVNDDEVRLYAAPSRDAAVVLELDRGMELVVIGPAAEAEGVVWWPVEEPATLTIGWVRAESLSVAGGVDRGVSHAAGGRDLVANAERSFASLRIFIKPLNILSEAKDLLIVIAGRSATR